MIPGIDWGLVAAILSFVSLFGVALLSLLVFATAREVRALREETYRQAVDEEHAESAPMR